MTDLFATLLRNNLARKGWDIHKVGRRWAIDRDGHRVTTCATEVNAITTAGMMDELGEESMFNHERDTRDLAATAAE